MATVESTILDALLGHVRLLSLPSPLPVAWPGVPFKRDDAVRSPFLWANNLPNAVEQITIGDAGYNRYRGLLQVSVMWPAGVGTAEATEAAGQIAAHFKRGTILEKSGLHVRVYRPPAMASVLDDGPMIHIPVTIPWMCDANNLTTQYPPMVGSGAASLPAISMSAKGFVPTSLAALRLLLDASERDVSVLVIGDSTSNETFEWAYRFAEFLAGAYPQWSTEYSLWDDGTGQYGNPVSLSIGTGPYRLIFRNASVAGATSFHLIGSKFDAAIGDVAPDFVLWNHGHNVFAVGEHIMGHEAVRQAFPGAHHAMIRQNPRRDDDQMATRGALTIAAANLYGDMKQVDVYSRFIDAGKPADWYGDNIHPNATGQTEELDVLLADWAEAATAQAPNVAPAFMATVGENVVANPRFADFTGATPTDWTSFSSVVATADTGIVDGSSPYSVKLTGALAGGRLVQGFGPDKRSVIAGETVALAVRMFVPSGMPPTVGRLFHNINGTQTTTRIVALPQGRWFWSFMTPIDVPEALTAFSFGIYCDSAANADSIVYIDRVSLVIGPEPRDTE